MTLRTPILFIIFNQPEITRQVFSAIKNIKPQKLYVAADGPRLLEPNDMAECEETRKIILEVDWECEVKCNFRQNNVGCRGNVSSAITWFLDEVDEGIILEYDCLPNEDFFKFCEFMLNYYRDNKNILSIAGTNFQFGKKWGDGSYYFSRIPTTWGWATWKRAWKKWDGDVSLLPSFIETEQMSNYFFNFKVSSFWLGKFLDVFEKKNKTTWGFSWVFAHFANNGLVVVPNENLVSNIGFSEKATHAKDPKSKFSKIKTRPLSKIKHPNFNIPCRKADEEFTKILLFIPTSTRIANLVKSFVKFLLPISFHDKIKQVIFKIIS